MRNRTNAKCFFSETYSYFERQTLSRMQSAGFTTTEMTMISMMSLYSEIGDPVGVEDSAMRVMAGMRSSAINSPSLVHLYVLKALVRRPSGNNWDEVKSYYCEYIESATNKQRIRMDAELMKAFKKFNQVADAINWFDCYLESEGRVSPNLLYLFQNVLGDDRFESYVRGLNIRSKNKIKNSAASSYKFDSNLLQIGLMEA